ncbi:hypothetical protein COT97_05355 [Candidatus Falkowbacteria bacterium CG10_big_fil_rev_8_21_14_0_10_39_11]|uniref:Uncharacterized protein n=1 Tax=Candidatus Falkowbacteria bacterium CG10_big_fil_rev_8_21_14_0_10_39_11 TaxID=1974565 RepID=A0A2H0V5Q8_9BACT|nr:MAG: hypothetical protein COT97_05355 [Candidatus Falkowbacteria bacterium CG10_big_fil_rev_8_21_14_0_10_39_11]
MTESKEKKNFLSRLVDFLEHETLNLKSENLATMCGKSETLKAKIADREQELKQRLEAGESTGEPALDFALRKFGADLELIYKTRALFKILNESSGQWIVIRIYFEEGYEFGAREVKTMPGIRTVLAKLADPGFSVRYAKYSQDIILHFSCGVIDEMGISRNGMTKIEQFTLRLDATKIIQDETELFFNPHSQTYIDDDPTSIEFCTDNQGPTFIMIDKAKAEEILGCPMPESAIERLLKKQDK